jgi:hypothetical protein
MGLTPTPCLARPPMTVSDIYRVRTLIRCKGGRLLRVNENVQFYYGHCGNVRFFSPFDKKRTNVPSIDPRCAQTACTMTARWDNNRPSIR